jgi:uncharacterized membrane protein YjjP (DUF1212 family)
MNIKELILILIIFIISYLIIYLDRILNKCNKCNLNIKKISCNTPIIITILFYIIYSIYIKNIIDINNNHLNILNEPPDF